MSLFLSIICLTYAVVSKSTTIPKLVNKIYKNGANDVVEFIDVNGLNEIVEFEMETIATGFKFLEGPRWIPGEYSSTGTPYLLFTELATHTIWKYDEQNKQNPFEIVADFDQLQCGPAGIAWDKNFADELWIACFFSGHILRLNSSTFQITKRYDYTDFPANNKVQFQVDDIIMDSKGNVFFTDMPVPPMRKCNPYHRGGTFMISRDNLDEVQLIELLDFGPNGIALSKDESLFTVSNSIDMSLDRDSMFDKTEHDYEKVYIRGYRYNDDGAIVPFMYFNPNDPKFNDYFSNGGTSHYVLDSSGFDYNGNMWQAVFLANVSDNKFNRGQASIFTNNAFGTQPKYIGSIRVSDAELQFANFEVGGDGYMYAVGGDFFVQKGGLSRFKLKGQLAPKDEL